ncbi:MAG TPA: flippase-like domain-containing protein, partial [Methanothermococcus okinawensis]|nr:flippase-like domain-containing protein [Methanothermococcus okinawensis]
MNIKKCLMTILMGALGLIIILLIVWDIGIQNTISIFFSSNIYLYLLAVFIYFLVVFILVLRWRYILSINNYPRVSLKNLFLLVMMGQLINNITPSMKGGSEPFRAYYLSKLENIPKHVSFSSVIVERLLDTIVFLVLSLFVIIYLLIKGMVYVRELIVIWILVGIITLLGLYVIMHESLPYRIVLKLTEIISRFSSRCISKNKIHDAIEKLQKNIMFLNDNKRKMAVPLLLSFGW